MKTLKEITDWINYHTDADAKMHSDFFSIEFLYIGDAPPDTYSHYYINEPAEFEMLEQEILLGCDEIKYFDSPEQREEVREEYLKQFRADPSKPDIPF